MVMLFLGDVGGGELLLIMLVVLLFFGSKQIPQLARGLGKGIREFKDAANGIQREIEKSIHEVPVTEEKVVERIEPKPLQEYIEPEIVEETKAELPEIKPAPGSIAREV